MGAKTRSRSNVAAPGSMLLGAACLLVLAAVTSCAPDAASAASAAQDFHRAVDASDWSAACALLQPETREKTVDQVGGSCEAGLEALQLPEAGPLMKTEAYGREALVKFDNDAVFVAVSGSGWQITAAGCRPQGESAYSCEVGGK
jgi:hypothetical protein